MSMPEKWTGRLVGRMHNEKISATELAEEMCVTKSYMSMILQGRRKPPDIQKRCEAALQRIIDRRKAMQ